LVEFSSCDLLRREAKFIRHLHVMQYVAASILSCLAQAELIDASETFRCIVDVRLLVTDKLLSVPAGPDAIKLL
jgi:hypothetical protein